MYQTHNYQNQLRLNTATGEVLQVQDDGQSWKICDAMEDGGETDNRFCLYETQNMWTFIMLDTFTGKNWEARMGYANGDVSNDRHKSFLVGSFRLNEEWYFEFVFFHFSVVFF